MATLEEKVAAIRAKRQQARVTGPSLEERVEAIRQRKAQQEASPEEAPVAPTPVDPDSAASAFGRGVDQMQASFGGAVETLGEVTGSEYLQEAGAEFRKEQLEEASQYGQPTISSYKQVDFSDATQVGEYLKQLGLGAAPGTATSLASGIAGAKLGSHAGPRGAIAGGILGALTTAFPMNIGEVQNAMKEIDPESKSPWSAVLGGTAISSLDVIGLGSIAKPLVKVIGKDLAAKALVEQGVAKEAAIQAVKGAITEGATEAAQEGIKAVAAAEGTDTNVNTEKLMEDMINSAIAGKVLGGVAGGGSGALAANLNNQNVAGGGTQVDPTTGRTKPLNMAQRAWDTLGSEATALLEPLARVSPEINKFVRKLRPDMTGATASEATIFEGSDLMVGKWRKSIEEGLRGQDIDEAFSDYLDGKSSKGADAIKNTLEDVLKTAKRDGKLDVGQISNYLPTRLDPGKITANEQEFLSDIAPYVPNPKVALDNWVAQQGVDRGNAVPKVDRAVQMDAMGNWVSMPQYQKKGDPESFRYKFAQGTVPPEFGHLEKSRAFAKVPQKVLEKYTKEESSVDKLQAIQDYFEGAAHRIAFAKEFGPSGEKLNFQIVKGIKEAQTRGYNPTKQEVDRMYNLLDAYNGMYHRIETEGLKTAQSIAATGLTMKALPLTVLSSLVEVFTPAIRGDISAAIIEIIPTIAQVSHDVVRQVLKSVPRTEFSSFASEANITLGASLNIAAERLGTNVFNRGSAKVLKAYFLTNALSFWTHFLSVYSARTANHIYDRNLYKLSSGVPITSANGVNLANQLRSIGVPVYSNADAQILYNPGTQSQRDASRAYRVLSMRRFKDQTILNPNIADTPMWMSNGHMQLIALLKRYPAAYSNIILPALGRKFRTSWAGSRTNAAVGAAGAMFLVGMILMVGYIQDELKQLAKQGEDIRTEAQRFADVVNSTMMPLQLSLVTDFVAAPRYGTSPVTAVAGPAAGLAEDTLKTITSVANNPKEGEIWKYLYKQTPAQFYRPGREAAGEFELEDVFD